MHRRKSEDDKNPPFDINMATSKPAMKGKPPKLVMTTTDAENLYGDTDTESILPSAVRMRLQDLFSRIEKEFELLYLDNLTLLEKMEKREVEKTEQETVCAVVGGESLPKSAKLQPNKSALAVISPQQKLKTAYRLRAQTSKIVSSFKTPLVNCNLVREFSGHRDGIWEVATAHTGQPLIGTASADHTAKIWHIENGECALQYTGHTGSVNSIRFHPSKELVLTASGDQTAHIWQAANSANEDPDGNDEELDNDLCSLRTPLRSLTGHSNVVTAADWLPDGDQVITASWDRTASLYDVETGELLQCLSGHDQELVHTAAHHAQKLVVTSSRDTTFRLWDFREPIHSVSVFQGHTKTVTCTVFAKNCDDKLVSGSDDRTIKVWDLRNMRSSLATIHADSGINKLAISPSGLIAIPYDNRQVRLYDLQGQRLARLPKTSAKGHRRMVCSVAWADDDAFSCNFFSCGFDRLILGWSIQSNKD